MKIYDFGGKKNISGDRIHQARTALRLSQSELAARMHLPVGAVYKEIVSGETISPTETKYFFSLS